MQVWGKVVGTILGFMFGKAPGAVLGLVVGHFFDISYGKDFNSQGGFARFFTSKSDFQTQAEFFHSLFSALGHICKADGTVTSQDIQTASSLMDDMGLTGDVRQEAQQAFREGKARDFPLPEMLKQFKENSHHRRDILQVYLEILIKASCTTSRLSSPKLSVLETIAVALGFTRKELGLFVVAYEAEMRFRRGQAQNAKRTASSRQPNSANQHRQNGASSGSSSSRTWSSSSSSTSRGGGDNQSESSSQYHDYSEQRQSKASYSTELELQDAYKIIGVGVSDDQKQIKKAYKKLMATHHPDKLMAKGLPKQAIEIAKQKAQDIQAAYSLIKQRKGF